MATVVLRTSRYYQHKMCISKRTSEYLASYNVILLTASSNYVSLLEWMEA